MTTVGYGDKTPKFLVSKIFTVIWILFGITVVATFTASITTEISSVTTPTTPTMAGKKIGILKGRMYEASIVLNKGGYVAVTENASIESGMHELVEKIHNKEIDGYVIDKFTYAATYEMFNQSAEGDGHSMKEHADYFLRNLYKTDIPKSDMRLTYGMLIKDEDDYDYFREYIVDNRHNLMTCKELQLHLHFYGKSMTSYNIFQPNGPAFRITIIVVVSAIGVIFSMGIIYEFSRMMIKKKIAKNMKDTCRTGRSSTRRP